MAQNLYPSYLYRSALRYLIPMSQVTESSTPMDDANEYPQSPLITPQSPDVSDKDQHLEMDLGDSPASESSQTSPTKRKSLQTSQTKRQSPRKRLRPSTPDDNKDEDGSDDDARFGAHDVSYRKILAPNCHHEISHHWVNVSGIKWPAVTDQTIRDFVKTHKYFSIRRNDALNASTFTRIFQEIRGQAIMKGWTPEDDKKLSDKLTRKIINIRTEMIAAGELVKRPNGEFSLVAGYAEPADGSETVRRVLQNVATLSKLELEVVLKDLIRRVDDEKRVIRLMVSVMDPE